MVVQSKCEEIVWQRFLFTAPMVSLYFMYVLVEGCFLVKLTKSGQTPDLDLPLSEK